MLAENQRGEVGLVHQTSSLPSAKLKQENSQPAQDTPGEFRNLGVGSDGLDSVVWLGKGGRCL